MRLLKRKISVVLGFLLTLSVMLQAQEQPHITGSFPHEGSTDILRNAFITVKLGLPNGPLDSRSVNTDNIKLYPTNRPDEIVPAFITLNNRLWALIFEPYGMLSANTSYTFEISDRVKDEKGVAFQAARFRFETGEKGYRKLITMSRPFGERPEVGEWEEEDVSGENLSAPFLREATPKAAPPQVEEPPKPMKPERSRDELLRMVLRFYGGPKLPPGFGPTVLDAPQMPALPVVASLREIPVSFETLMDLAQVWPEDTMEDASDTFAEVPLADQQNLSPRQTKEPTDAPVAAPEISIRDKWIMAALDEMEFNSQWQAVSAPRFAAPQRLASRQAPISQAAFDRLLTAVNEQLIEEEKQAELALAEAARRKAGREIEEQIARETAEAQKQALAQKQAIQEKWQAVNWDNIEPEHSTYQVQPKGSPVPAQLALREAPISKAEVESLLSEVNQAMLEEDKQEELALAANASREAEEAAAQQAAIEAEQAEKQALAQKKATREKWQAVSWNNISPEKSADFVKPAEAPVPSLLALREAPISREEVESLLSEVNQAFLEEEKQAGTAIAIAEPETPNSELRTPTSPSLNTASLLVEETIRNESKAGKIVFPQTAIFMNEYVLVEFDLPQREFVSFVLRDIKGDVYRTEGGYVEAGPHKRAVTLEGVPPGAYEAVVETIHQKVVRKVTILE